MALTERGQEIVEWAGAPGILELLGEEIPEAELVHQRIVQERVELVRTAVGVVLLERHERALQEADLAQTVLAQLGVTVGSETAAEEPDRLLSTEAAIALGFNKGLVTKVWNALHREQTQLQLTEQALLKPDLTDDRRAQLEAEVRKLRKFAGLFPEPDIMSVRRLQQLMASGKLDIRNIGTASLGIMRNIAALEIEEPRAD